MNAIDLDTLNKLIDVITKMKTTHETGIITQSLDHLSNKRFNPTHIMNDAKTISMDNKIIVSLDDVIELENTLITVFDDIATFMNNNVPHNTNNVSNDSTYIQQIQELNEKIHDLKYDNDSMETDLIELTLELTKASERITNQTYRINTLSSNEQSLRKRIADLVKVNEELSKNNARLTNKLHERITYVNTEDTDLIVDNFDDVPFSYSIEYLNQYILNDNSLYEGTDLKDVFNESLSILSDTTRATEPIYIITSVNGKVFSRLNINDTRDKVLNNIYLDKDKISKKTIISLMIRELTIINKAIFRKIQLSNSVLPEAVNG